jgi:hypothetical protein
VVDEAQDLIQINLILLVIMVVLVVEVVDNLCLQVKEQRIKDMMVVRVIQEATVVVAVVVLAVLV